MNIKNYISYILNNCHPIGYEDHEDLAERIYTYIKPFLKQEQIPEEDNELPHQ